MHSPILAPVAMLVLWSMVVLIWVTVTRFVGISRLSPDQRQTLAKDGIRGQDLERLLPQNANWKSHNYTHLMEQPTVFYAAAMILALAGTGAGINATLAWAYAALRILHSIWQAMVNTLPVRMSLFTASSLCLIALAVNAARAAI